MIEGFIQRCRASMNSLRPADRTEGSYKVSMNHSRPLAVLLKQASFTKMCGILKAWRTVTPQRLALFAAIVLVILQATNHAAAFVFKLPLKEPIPLELIQKLPVALQRIAAGSVYYENRRFLILQNRNPQFCVGKKCTTVLVPKCGSAECQYTVALTGKIFAVGESWTETKIANEAVFPLHAYCEIEGEAFLRTPNSTFWVGKNFVVLSQSAQDDCP